MFTHHPVRDGSVISISIYGPHGKRFARRIAEEAVGKNERLGDNFSIVEVGNRQEFFFNVEALAVQTAPVRADRKIAKRHLQLRPVELLARWSRPQIPSAG